MTVTRLRRAHTSETPPPLPSYASGVSDQPLLGETIGQRFDRIATEHADREALVDRATGVRRTYAELRTEVDALAHGLLRAGIAKGDRVGIWAPNCPEWTLVQYATAKIGAILVNINPAYGQQELEYVLNQAGIRQLVAVPGFRTADYAAMIAAARPSCPQLRRVTLIGTDGWRRLLEHEGDPAALRERAAMLSPDDAINIQYTSGTTGHPKGATLSHHNILNNAHAIGRIARYTQRDRICLPVPLYHTFGMVIGNLGAMTYGACVVHPSPSFDAGDTLAAIDEERCTSVYGVPSMFIAELTHPDFDRYDLSSLRTGLMGGSPCPVEVMREVVGRMGIGEVMIVYGMTETSPVSTQTRADDPFERRVTTVGQVHPHLEVKVIDPETGTIVPRGTPGEICTRGYSVMLGYWNQPDQTAEVIDEARWMHTGDIGTMDAAGYLNITGRLKDMVIRGGENIYPREIEEFLHGHPDIRDVHVVGVPDARLGEEIMAWVQLEPGAPTMTAETIREFAAGRLARFKLPRYVRVVDDFPMTVSGKVRKVEMRATSIELLGLEALAETKTA